MFRKTMVCLMLLLFLSSGAGWAEGPMKIGVLAKDGPVKAIKMWKATVDHLNGKLGENRFVLVPLDFDAASNAIAKEEVDFFIVNSSMFVTAKVQSGATAMATMVNARQGRSWSAFGGVIITSEENEAINGLADLAGKSFMGVEESSFGGWQMAYKEMLFAGIDPQKDFSKVQFGGKQANVVYAVLSGIVDAGTVRTDTLERLAAEGSIELSDFKIIHPVDHDGFPFACSTSLYPEWPFARTKHVSDEAANEVLNALKQIKPEDPAAKDAKIAGWVDAMDYEPVEKLQELLRIGAFRRNKC